MLFTALLLTAVAGQAAAGTISHRHAHEQAHAQRRAELNDFSKRGAMIANANGFLSGKGSLTGKNANTPGSVWFGNQGPYTITFNNAAADAKDAVVVVWGKAASWVNVHQPEITAPLAAGENVTISVAEGVTLGWGGIRDDDAMRDGQWAVPFGELTTAGQWTTYDVSYQPKTNGRDMSIVGPACTSDKTQCSFHCKDKSLEFCLTGYEVPNCDASNGGGQGIDYTGTGEVGGGCNGLNGGGHLDVLLH